MDFVIALLALFGVFSSQEEILTPRPLPTFSASLRMGPTTQNWTVARREFNYGKEESRALTIKASFEITVAAGDELIVPMRNPRDPEDIANLRTSVISMEVIEREDGIFRILTLTAPLGIPKGWVPAGGPHELRAIRAQQPPAPKPEAETKPTKAHHHHSVVKDGKIVIVCCSSTSCNTP
jgi:hypothetical protein